MQDWLKIILRDLTWGYCCTSLFYYEKIMKITNKWITGFVDSDGTFYVGKNDITRFNVSQDKSSVDCLYALKETFGCGSVRHAGGNMMCYTVGNISALETKIIPFFDKYGLQTTLRQRQFLNLKKRLFSGENTIGQGKAQHHNLDTNWLTGFLDGDGRFSCSFVGSYPRPQLSILAAGEERPLFEAIKVFLNCGTVYARKRVPGGAGDPYVVFQVSSTMDLWEKVFPHLFFRDNSPRLKTKKCISLQKFKKIVRIIRDKQHLTEAGRLEIAKLQNNLNPKAKIFQVDSAAIKKL